MATKTHATSSSRSSFVFTLRKRTARISPFSSGMYFVTTVFQIGSIFLFANTRSGHDFRRAQFVAPMNQINLRGEAGEEQRLFRRGIAAAHDADRHVSVKRAVASRAGRQAMADQFLFVLQSELSRRRRRWR